MRPLKKAFLVLLSKIWKYAQEAKGLTFLSYSIQHKT